MSLPYIGQQITVYVGAFFVFIGTIGNGINILVFSSTRNYRKTPCTFYFLITSICSIVYITMYPIARIINIGFGSALIRSPTSWCKIQQFTIAVLSVIALSCSCLSTIDQFLITSQSANLRRFSNIKWAHRIVIIISIIGSLHGIPLILFYNISPTTGMCVNNSNASYGIYILVYFIVVLSAAPVIIMVLFTYLAHHNIHLTRVLAEQQYDRQLLRMTMIQVVLVVISFVPYCINNAYSLITSKVSKDTYRLMIENLILQICIAMLYIYYGGSCYMFLISSNRFRRTTKDRILFFLKRNQVTPLELRTIRRTTN